MVPIWGKWIKNNVFWTQISYRYLYSVLELKWSELIMKIYEYKILNVLQGGCSLSVQNGQITISTNMRAFFNLIGGEPFY